MSKSHPAPHPGPRPDPQPDSQSAEPGRSGTAPAAVPPAAERTSGAGTPVATRLSVRLPFVVALAAVSAAFLVTVPLFRDWFDLHVYYGAINFWRHDSGSLYDYLVPGTHYGFTYPPFAAVTMLPMSLLDWPAALALCLAMNAFAAGAILAWSLHGMIRREGWSRWFTYATAISLFALLEPVRDTVSFGQVNLLLLALVLLDAHLLATGRGKWAGIATGLAAAIKLTPAIFILYLLVTGRRRAAATAAGVALGATGLTALLAPGASRTFWTEALWNTDRVGSLGYVSNQSWQGVLARLGEPAEPSRALWALGVLAILALWARRARRAVAAGDERAGIALTGLAACLVSPVTWVHHLVWVVPALAVLLDTSLRLPEHDPSRRKMLITTGALYITLCSSLVWIWRFDPAGPLGLLGSNAYVWVCLGLLWALPVGDRSALAGSARTPVATALATARGLEAGRG